jgi:hypothetical protein
MNKSNSIPLYRDKSWLQENYGKTKSIYKTAEVCGCSYRTIHQWLIRFGIARIGQINYKHSDETKAKMSSAARGKRTMLGKKHSAETRLKMSNDRKGVLNSNWKGGKTELIRKFRKSKEYVAWRNKVLERADFKCEECGSPKKLEAHHIISLNNDFSKALDLDNGAALCAACHQKIEGRYKQ